MKRVNLVWILVLLMASFSACTKNEYYIVDPTNEESEDKSSYTIMMYGCGGGNLDKYMILNIQEALLHGSTDRVKFTGQVKFSARFQDTEEFKGTQRFIVGEEKDLWYTPVEVMDSELELYNPKNLTDFINWSKKNAPADEYILLLWNHGSAWMPAYDHPNSRAVIHDDVLDGRALTLDDLVKGIKDSGTKLKMIYYDTCLMGMIEVLTGVKDCAEYALCASHATPGIGGDYNSLIYHLDKSTNFEDAISSYGRELISHWENQKYPFDIKLVNLSKMDNLLENVKVLSGYLEENAKIASEVLHAIESGVNISPYDNNNLIADAYHNALNKSYNYDSKRDTNGAAKYPFFDLLMLVENMASFPIANSYSARYINIASGINRSLKEAIVTQYVTSIAQGWDFTLGVTIVNKDYWKSKDYDSSYNKLEFDRVTNWGKWLSINPQIPVGNPDPMTIMGDDNTDIDEQYPQPSFEEELELMLQLIGKH